MKKLILILFCMPMLSAMGSFLTCREAATASYNENKILLKLSSGLLSEEHYVHSRKEIEDGALKKILKQFRVADLRSVFKSRYNAQGYLKENIALSGKELLQGWFELSLDKRFDPGEFVFLLQQQKGIEHAFVEMPMLMEPALIPDDTNYGWQWHLNNPSNRDFDISAEDAWDINTGNSDVIVAVLDGGVDYTHPDLDPGDRSRVIAGIDTGDGNNDPMDDLAGDEGFGGHGTLVAGVIGAITDNANQVAGVMWNCKIMPVKMVRSGGIRIPHILDWDWSTAAFPSDVADAIDYAVNNGAHVINLSYSFPDMGWPINEIALRIPLLFQAINNAYQNNVVITASMGNHFATDNSTRYPAGFREQVIAVGATDPNGTRSAFSNTGSHINLSAPGTGIWTTERGGGIRNPNGTSFSAPIVAGVAGLIISQGMDRGFNLTNDDVRHIMELTSTDVDDPGFDHNTGHGIVNAHHALQLLDEPNELFHYSSTGGTEQMVQNLPQWILHSGRWGLAAGAYFNVDQYKITKRVDFEVPFCSPPTVWMRERQSQSMSYANPNSGEPFTIISNVDNTGFDLEYVVYYVRNNALGQTINKWIPSAPQSAQVAYTVTGEPNPAASGGPISGPDLLCSSETYTISNVPAGATVTWSALPSGAVSLSGSGNSRTVAWSGWHFGEVTLTAMVTTDCGTAEISKVISVGGIPQNELTVIGDRLVCYGNYLYTVQYFGHMPIIGYQWHFPPGYSATVVDPISAPNQWMISIPPYEMFPQTMELFVQTPCGNQGPWMIELWEQSPGCASPFIFSVYPNPADGEFSVVGNMEFQSAQHEKAIVHPEFSATLFDENGNPKLEKNSVDGQILFKTGQVPAGVYVLQIRHNGNKEERQILIRH